jgi:hypothetical protein
MVKVFLFFFPERLLTFLTEAEHGLFHEVLSDCRECAVRSHHHVRILLFSFISGRPVRDGKFSANAEIGLVQGCDVLRKVYPTC